MSSDKTILIVEDDSQLREVYTMALELEGFNVVQAEDGQDALNKLLNLDELLIPDCIVLDLKMPTMTGNAFLKIIRTNYKSRFDHVPVVVCSAQGDEVDPSHISFMLHKPISLDLFVEKIESAMKMAELKRSIQFSQDL